MAADPASLTGRSSRAALLGVALAGLLAAAFPVRGDWTGEWDTRWKGGGATLTLRRDGDRVTGRYPLYSGRIDGVVQGTKLTGTWTEQQAVTRQGKFEFILSADGRTFAGMFESGEWWNGTRIDKPRSMPYLNPDLSTPRAAVRSLLIAGNRARAGLYDYQGTMLACVDLGPTAAELPIGQRIARVSQLFDLIDRTTLRVWDVPAGEAKPPVKVAFRQSGTGETVDLTIALDGDGGGRWRIVAPEVKDVVEAGARLDAARRKAAGATTAPSASIDDTDAQLQLRSPRDTMRTFIEAMRRGGPNAQEQLRSTLDLSQVNGGLVGIEAPVVVDCLAQVLDRISYIIQQEVPDDPAATSPYVHFEHPAGDVLIAPTVRDGRRVWLFSPETVASIRRLYDATETAEHRGDLTVGVVRPLFFRVRDWARQISPRLSRQTLLLENWQWLGLLVLVPLGLAAGWLVSLPARWLARRKLGAEVFNRRVARRLAWPLRLLILALICNAGITLLGLQQPVLRVAVVVVSILIGAGITFTLYAIVDLVGTWLLRRAHETATKFDDVMVALGGAVAKIVIIVAGAIATAEFLALPYRSLLAGLGIGGLAIGLAAQDTLKSYLGAFSFVMDRPFKVGDWVKFGDVEGAVEGVGLRSVRVRRADNTLIVVPNAEVIRKSMANLGKRAFRRQRTTLRVNYATEPDRLDAYCQALRSLIHDHPKTRKDRVHVYVAALAESAIDVYVDFYVQAEDMEAELRERHGLLLEMIRIAGRMGVDFAFPTTTVHFAGDGRGGSGVNGPREVAAGAAAAGVAAAPKTAIEPRRAPEDDTPP